MEASNLKCMQGGEHVEASNEVSTSSASNEFVDGQRRAAAVGLSSNNRAVGATRRSPASVPFLRWP